MIGRTAAISVAFGALRGPRADLPSCRFPTIIPPHQSLFKSEFGAGNRALTSSHQRGTVAIELPRETDQRLRSSIQRFFAEHLDEEIGEMKARLVLEYVLKEIGPSIYNKAVSDAQAWFQERTADLDATCYEKEFTFWNPLPPRKPGTPDR